MTATKITAAQQTQSAPCDVGYGKPPWHTRFQKGQSGNPAGRPRGREPFGRLKELTLQEAYRGITVRDEDGVAHPALAIQQILRSQIELAMNGNARAQREILKAVRDYEQEDAEAAALDAFVEGVVREARDLEEGIRAARAAIDAAPASKKIDYAAAAQQVRTLLRLDECKAKTKAVQGETAEGGAAEDQTCASGKETGAGARAEESGAGRNAAATPPAETTAAETPAAETTAAERRSGDPAASAADAQPPENDSAQVAPPAASPGPSAGRRAVPPADRRPQRSSPDRPARCGAREATPAPGADVPHKRTGRPMGKSPRDRGLHLRTGRPARPSAAPGKRTAAGTADGKK